MGLVLPNKAFCGCGVGYPAVARGFLTPWAVTSIIKLWDSCHMGRVTAFLVGDPFPCSVRPAERQQAPVVDSADPDLRSCGCGLTVGRSAAQLTLAQSLSRPSAFDGAV